MPSHYDAEKKCRVGTMDEDQFYAECEKANGAYFRSLISAWIKTGGTLKWGAGGAGLRGNIYKKETGVCFLAPQFAGKKDRIELACTALVKQIGKPAADKLESALRAAAGDRVLGKTMMSIVQPGELPPAQQNKLTKAFTDLL
ncbi:MAG: hypothetical protein AABZ47_00700 [Planctomycetota bacterium]